MIVLCKILLRHFMLDKVLKHLGSDIDAKTKLSEIKKIIICYCTKEKHILECYRNLKHLELDVLEFSDSNEDKGFINKIAKIIETEIDILHVRMKVAQNLDDVGEESSSAALRLKWTDSKTDMVELIYCIKNSIENGKVSIKHIKNCFEHLFQINLGNVYDIINDISLRKINRTRYIDRMNLNFQNILDRLDA